MSTANSVYFVGFNPGSFGLGHSNNLKKLTKCPNKSIQRVYSGNGHCIYADDDLTNLWGSGYNEEAQLCIHPKTNCITSYEPITYFRDNNIKISKICTNVVSVQTWFIDHEGQLYVCGNPSMGKLGIASSEIDSPHIITDFAGKVVVDVKASFHCCIALCESNNKQISLIITYFGRIYNVNDDIMNLLFSFSKTRTVYSTTNKQGSGHPQNRIFNDGKGWHEIEYFTQNNINIIKVEMSGIFSLFLDDLGRVSECGGTKGDAYLPREIEYFKQNDIKIKDIAVGDGHALVLDIHGKVFSWGNNSDGECGHFDTDYNILQIMDLDDYVVDTIKCGWKHSFVKTTCGRYYLFGCNDDNECLTFDDRDQVRRPHRFDLILKEKYKIDEIIDVSMGEYNTKIVCSTVV